MESNLEPIESQCGISPDDTSFRQVESDPNYIFENDPSFETIVLYDSEGNIVNVNSWVECAHYVDGGWSNLSPSTVAGDRIIFSGLVVITILYIVLKKTYFLYAKN
tara:strand:+ start:163 stop:480 length:318 start_codon:yes stop_codon:yes gene_type:complete